MPAASKPSANLGTSGRTPGHAPNPIGDSPLDQAPPPSSRICNVCMFHIQASFHNRISTPTFLGAVPSQLSLCVIGGAGFPLSAGGEQQLKTVQVAASVCLSQRRTHARGCWSHPGHQQQAQGQPQPCQAPLASEQKEKSVRWILSVFKTVIFCLVDICLGFFL